MTQAYCQTTKIKDKEKIKMTPKSSQKKNSMFCTKGYDLNNH